MVIATLLLVLPGQIETFDSRDFTRDLQRSVSLATVKVANGEKAEGSGVLIRQKGAFAYVLTAHHLAGRAENLEISLYSAKSYPRPARVVRSVEVLARAPDADLTLLRFAIAGPIESLSIAPLKQVPAPAFEGLTCGCGSGSPPACRIEKIEARKKIRRSADGGPCLVWESSRQPDGGRSGGPLVDRNGRLLGICSGTSNGKGYYVHIEEIHGFLKRNRLLD